MILRSYPLCLGGIWLEFTAGAGAVGEELSDSSTSIDVLHRKTCMNISFGWCYFIPVVAILGGKGIDDSWDPQYLLQG